MSSLLPISQKECRLGGDQQHCGDGKELRKYHWGVRAYCPYFYIFLQEDLFNIRGGIPLAFKCAHCLEADKEDKNIS